ncbi:hypothetical protein AMI01nite_32750 [Aneurinibacillus migulanus]|nr:hypothetical protein AMI01nite_32750 [Aneurinibacillus migulanus]
MKNGFTKHYMIKQIEEYSPISYHINIIKAKTIGYYMLRLGFSVLIPVLRIRLRIFD